MLGKLIKHDFKSLSRVLFPTQLAVLGATVIATIGFAINMRGNFNSAVENGSMQLIRFLFGSISVLMLIAIVAASFLVMFIIFERFYKSFMCSEGYLTFTLPVTTTELLWSKLITAMIWSFISGIVIIICMNIFVLFGTGNSGIVNTEVYRQLITMKREIISTLGGKLVLPTIEFILLMIISTAYKILQVYLALIIGGIVSQKHKILAGIGFYFVISIVVSVLSSIMQFCLLGSARSMESSITGITGSIANGAEIFDKVFSAAQPFIISYFVFMIVIAAAFFLLSRYFLTNKLNLE
jgi:hypothetical protein